MKQKIEDKILEELIDRIIQKDREIKNRYEEESIRNATKEVLIEMTDLSGSEINKIEKDIRNSMRAKPRKSYLIYVVILILLIVSVVFLFKYFESNHYKDQLIFEENFDDNDNTWDIFDDFLYRTYFDDSKYTFVTNQKDQCFIENLSIKFPASFTVEVTSTYKGGKYSNYGLRMNLGSTFENTFYLHPENKTYIGFMNNELKESWISFPLLNKNKAQTHIQKITAKPISNKYINGMPVGQFKYYVNNKFIGEGIYQNPSKSTIGLIVNGSRKVSYDHIKLFDESSGKLIIDGTFEELKNKPKTKSEFDLMSFIENGQYILRSNIKEECNSTTIPFEIKKHAKIKLKSTWLDGENYYYGLILKSDRANYYAFELKRDGSACFIKHADGKNEVFIDDIDTGVSSDFSSDFSSDGKISIEQTVILSGNKLEYYVNEKLVHTEESSRLSISNIGLRVCGRQGVAFDKLEIWE